MAAALNVPVVVAPADKVAVVVAAALNVPVVVAPADKVAVVALPALNVPVVVAPADKVVLEVVSPSVKTPEPPINTSDGYPGTCAKALEEKGNVSAYPEPTSKAASK